MSVDTETLKTLKQDRQDAAYWLWDEPEIMETKKNEIHYYPHAGRLVIRLPQYNSKLGALTSLNLKYLAKAPDVLDRLIDILTALKSADSAES